MLPRAEILAVKNGVAPPAAISVEQAKRLLTTAVAMMHGMAAPGRCYRTVLRPRSRVYENLVHV
ncbi:hypothetical protein A7J71_05860 [Achromobacter insolitus]|nr:hypothetical protein A7J71_05860 [Achromobacter insolitus]OCZ56778.1 hypothetical protein A7P22_04345 [Achromobacter insolitus]